MEINPRTETGNLNLLASGANVEAMCLTRVAQVVSTDGGKAKISYLDSHETTQVDVSMVQAKKGSYVEVYANVAIGRITKKEAEMKRDLRLDLLRQSGRES